MSDTTQSEDRGSESEASEEKPRTPPPSQRQQEQKQNSANVASTSDRIAIKEQPSATTSQDTNARRSDPSPLPSPPVPEEQQSSSSEATERESTEQDSIDDRFADYSESVRDEMRTLEKGAWEEKDPSLDPDEEINAFLNHGLPLPPKNYDALMMASLEELKELEELRTAQLTPEARQQVAYRRALVEGVPLEEQRWTRLRAYHRAAEQLRAARAAAKVGPLRELQLAEAGAPLDVVPQELIDMKPQQVLERRVQLQAVVDDGKHASSRAGSLAGYGPYSDESEWDFAAIASSSSHGLRHDPAARTALAAAVQKALGPGSRVPPAEARQSLEAEASSGAAGGDAEAAAGARAPHDDSDYIDVLDDRVPKVLYTPEVIDHLLLLMKQRQQQRQRSQAFWLSLLTVSGVSLWRLVRRLRRGGFKQKKAAGKGSKKAAAAGQAERA